MNSDYALAAAYATGVEPPAQAFATNHPPASLHQQPRRGQYQARAQANAMEEDFDFIEDAELPVVDDLEVAAAAAAAAMGEDATSSDSSEDESSEEEESDDSSGSESDSDSEDATMETEHLGPPGGSVEPEAQAQAGAVPARATTEAAQVHLSLQPNGVEGVTVLLVVRSEAGGEAEGAVGMQQDQAQHAEHGGDFVMRGRDESSESEDESSDDSDEEITDLAQIRQIIDAFDDEDEEGGGGASSAHRAEQELLGSLPVPVIDAGVVGADDVLSPAGAVQAVLEGMIVVKAGAGARALCEGSLLVLESRAVVGRVEEVFGPVASPLYALRYGGPAPMPEEVAAGAKLFSLDRLAEFVLPEQLQVRGSDAELAEEGEDPDVQFSDDEAEAEFKRKQKAKRKGGPEEGPQPAGGGGGGGRAQRGRGRGRGDSRGGGRGGGGGGRQAPPAYYHQQQQFPGGGGGRGGAPAPGPAGGRGRVFRGNPAPPAAFQASATAGQLAGMSLQQPYPGGGYPSPQAPPHGYGYAPPPQQPQQYMQYPPQQCAPQQYPPQYGQPPPQYGQPPPQYAQPPLQYGQYPPQQQPQHPQQQQQQYGQYPHYPPQQ